jgi:glycosyltransferase involved in cell wall biosynthesis
MIHPDNFKDFVSSKAEYSSVNRINSVAMPKFSIIIPSFNQSEFLEKTLLSIINQNYPNFEIIIIDGGSTDDTLSIIHKYKAYISYWVSEPDKGQAAALNKGFRFANGDIFGWQNSDDIYLPDAFWGVARIFASNKKIKIIYGNWYCIDVQDKVTETHYALKPRKPHSPYENIDAYNQCIFWRREVHERFGSFDESLHQKMDTDMVIRFLVGENLASFHRVNAFLGAFRQHARQKTDHNKMNDEVFFEEQAIERKMGFKSKQAIAGKYYRLRYRLAQLVESLYCGGPIYTFNRFITEYKKRGRFF